jgi:hypothetical protein
MSIHLITTLLVWLVCALRVAQHPHHFLVVEVFWRERQAHTHTREHASPGPQPASHSHKQINQSLHPSCIPPSKQPTKATATSVCAVPQPVCHNQSTRAPSKAFLYRHTQPQFRRAFRSSTTRSTLHQQRHHYIKHLAPSLQAIPLPTSAQQLAPNSPEILPYVHNGNPSGVPGWVWQPFSL